MVYLTKNDNTKETHDTTVKTAEEILNPPKK